MTERSLGEVQAMVRAAVRGAGRDWGTAAEVARGARWLAARGIDPTPALAALLDAPEGGAPADPRAVAWEDGLCPVRAGMALADFALLRPPALRVRLRHPLLLLPFLADLAAARGRPMVLGWGMGRAATDGARLSLGALPPPEAVVTLAQGGLGAPRPRADRATPAAWDALAALAARTHAPATETSRRGAGADDDPLE